MVSQASCYGKDTRRSSRVLDTALEPSLCGLMDDFCHFRQFVAKLIVKMVSQDAAVVCLATANSHWPDSGFYCMRLWLCRTGGRCTRPNRRNTLLITGRAWEA